jgi:RNA polymerase sigma factor (sigma-70 family)
MARPLSASLPDFIVAQRDPRSLTERAMRQEVSHQDFEQAIFPNLDAAYNYARWLTRDDHNAEDVVQESCLRAFKFFASFRGGNARAWLLAIVRNTYYSSLEKNRADTLTEEGYDLDALMAEETGGVDRSLEAADSRRVVNHALEQLPRQYREVIVLRELEEMSYQQIAGIANIPIGTVMSRLARARKLLHRLLRSSEPSNGTQSQPVAPRIGKYQN